MVILLNADYTFLQKITWKKAAFLMAKEIVDPVRDNTGKIIKLVRTVSQRYLIPAVLVLKKMIRRKYKRCVTWSRKQMWLRDDQKCQYCAIHLSTSKYEVDHVIPRDKGGKTSFENCVTSCRKCNQKKGNQTPRQAGMSLLKLPKALTVSEAVHNIEKEHNIHETLVELGIFA